MLSKAYIFYITKMYSTVMTVKFKCSFSLFKHYFEPRYST